MSDRDASGVDMVAPTGRIGDGRVFRDGDVVMVINPNFMPTVAERRSRYGDDPDREDPYPWIVAHEDARRSDSWARDGYLVQRGEYWSLAIRIAEDASRRHQVLMIHRPDTVSGLTCVDCHKTYPCPTARTMRDPA